MTKESSWVRFVVGLLVLSVGLVLTIKAKLGVSPWNVFHIGLTKHFDLTVGRANQLTGLVVVGLSYIIARVQPTIATIVNIVLVGIFIDLIMPLFPVAQGAIEKYFYLFSGLFIFSLGVGMYISSQCGTGPRDSLMMALDRKLDIKLGLVRNGIELTVLIIGYFLGVPVGIGTVCIALGVGPLVEWSLNVMNNLFSVTSAEAVKN